MQRVIWTLVAAVLILIAGWSGTVAGQAPAAQGADVTAALLVEVRGLRQAMERLASAGPRVQLALGRLQLQEQRVNTMLRRQAELTAQIASEEKKLAQWRDQLASTEDRARHAVDPAIRQQAESGIRFLTEMLEETTSELQRLRAEEVTTAQAIASEQNRWIDINAQLEALERALQK